MSLDENSGKLRYGWTTGACASACASAAFVGLITREMPRTITINLPKNRTAEFHLINTACYGDTAHATTIKDAGDDPDVTHGARISAHLRYHDTDTPIFLAGPGVGRITKPGLALDVGQAAINPKPREMICDNLMRIARAHGISPEVARRLAITISVANGSMIAHQTWNPRLGIIGGISILGTTGIVVPYSCSAWINSIHRGIDIALAQQRTHIGAATGKTSDMFLQKHMGLSAEEILDMGDFVGGVLKYLRRHPIAKLTIAGGFAKMTKLAQGHLDLHSKRSQVDFEQLAQFAKSIGMSTSDIAKIKAADNMGMILQDYRHTILPKALAVLAKQVANAKVEKSTIQIIMIDRMGEEIARA